MFPETVCLHHFDDGDRDFDLSHKPMQFQQNSRINPKPTEHDDILTAIVLALDNRHNS